MLCGEAKVKPHVSHVEQELPTLPEHLSSSQIFSDLVLLELSFSVCWFVIPSPTKLRRDIETLPPVRPFFRNIRVNTLESTSFNEF